MLDLAYLALMVVGPALCAGAIDWLIRSEDAATAVAPGAPEPDRAAAGTATERGLS